MVVRYEGGREKCEKRSGGRKGYHSEGAFFRMGFWKDVARADVQDEAGENSKIDEKRVFGKCEQHGRRGTRNGRERIREEERPGLFRRILVTEHEGDRIHAVGKSVRDNGKRYHESNREVDLESESDSDAVDETVGDEREGRHHADVRMVVVRVIGLVAMVDENRFFQKVESEKTASQRDHRMRRIEFVLVGDFENLRQELERNDSKQYSGRKSHYEMEAVFEFEGYESSNENRCESESGENSGIHYLERMCFHDYIRIFRNS